MTSAGETADEQMVRLSELRFAYPATPFRLQISHWEVARGRQVAVIGPSGSGKTTLLHLIAGILRPTAGVVGVEGKRLDELGDRELRAFRARRIGMVFQDFQLLEYLDVRENILLPYRIGTDLRISADVRRRADELAAAVGLGDRLRRNVTRLSQGERQRVALCRALITEPPLILADEPTGNLDPANKRKIMTLLQHHARRLDATLIVVTHDRDILSAMDGVVDFAEWTAGAG